MTPSDLDRLMSSREDEHLEFKEAKENYHFEKLAKYCAALANETGGRMVLGVTNRPPRKVVGSQAFDSLERTKAGLLDALHLRVEAEAIPHPNGRVLVFNVPSRPIGMPVQFEGAYWMRSGEDLRPMTPEMLRRIFAEAGPDFSAEVCEGALLDDLDPQGIDVLRRLWVRKSRNAALEKADTAQLLTDAELIDRKSVV